MNERKSRKLLTIMTAKKPVWRSRRIAIPATLDSNTIIARVKYAVIDINIRAAVWVKPICIAGIWRRHSGDMLYPDILAENGMNEPEWRVQKCKTSDGQAVDPDKLEK